MTTINNPNHPVVLFIPEAGIYPYLRGLAVLGDAVKRQGGRVLITHDTGQMLRSPIEAMYRIPVKASMFQKLKIRGVTEKYMKGVLKKYHFSPIELSDLLDDKLIKEINSLTSQAHGDLKKIVYKGFPVGKMAEFDFILETKFPYYPNLSDFHRELYLQYIKNTALTISITNKICEIYDPSLFVTFNEYAQCQAVRYSATKHKVKFMALTNPVHFNIDTSRFSIWEYSYRHWLTSHIQRWNRIKNIPVCEKYVKQSWQDSIFRMYTSGSHIFSSRKKNDPATIFDKLKLDPKRRTIVVYTSSQEERKCAGITMKIWKETDFAIDAFSNQIEWLCMLRDYVIKRNDLQIVVRIHPREGARQHGFSSQHLLKLKEEFKKSVPNFTIVWPDDPISSYDLMELADTCLIAWSTIGQEAARLGIPVLSCVSKMYYPNDDFIQTAITKKDYKRKLDKILKMDYKWNHLAKAIRFYHWRTFIPSLDLSKFIPADFDDRSIWPKVSLSTTKVINNILSGKQDLIKYNLKQWKKTLSKKTIFEETRAIKKGIRYFIDKTFYPPKKTGMVFRLWRYAWRKVTGNNLWNPPSDTDLNDYHLEYTEDILKLGVFVEKTKHNPKLRILMANGSLAILVNKGKLLTRMSPMVIRLAKLHNSV